MAPVLLFAGLAVLMNTLGWLICAIGETAVVYDLTGGLTFLVLAGFSYLYRAPPPPSAAAPSSAAAAPPSQLRQALASAMLAAWAARLSAFLFWRMLARGDKRLEKYVSDPIAFLVPFSLQAAWCFCDALPVLLVNALGSGGAVGGAWDALALAAWAAGAGLEVVADYQKSAFHARRGGGGGAPGPRFINTGVWAYSRHPNFFGQLVLQSALALFCAPAVFARGARPLLGALCVASPALEAFLILRVSGVPPLERDNKARFGDDPQFRRYVDTVPLLVPWWPKAGAGGKRRF